MLENVFLYRFYNIEEQHRSAVDTSLFFRITSVFLFHLNLINTIYFYCKDVTT